WDIARSAGELAGNKLRVNFSTEYSNKNWSTYLTVARSTCHIFLQFENDKKRIRTLLKDKKKKHAAASIYSDYTSDEFWDNACEKFVVESIKKKVPKCEISYE